MKKGKVLKGKKGGNKKASFRRRHGHPKHAAAPCESHEAVEAEASVNPPPHAVHRQWILSNFGIVSNGGSGLFMSQVSSKVIKESNYFCGPHGGQFS